MEHAPTMNESAKEREKIVTSQSEKPANNPDLLKRQFIRRFGVYSAGTCAGLYLLMSPHTSKAKGSDGAP